MTGHPNPASTLDDETHVRGRGDEQARVRCTSPCVEAAGAVLPLNCVMTALPIFDRDGNALVDFRFAAEEELVYPVEQGAVPASLVVVAHADTVLMMFDSRRKQWELPGGMREPGESPHEAATRELCEETGIRGESLTFVAVAEFELLKPERLEALAIYETRLRFVPRLTVNDEALDFRWWPPSEPVSENMSPLDAEIARRVIRSSAT